MQPSQNALDLIKKFEGCRLTSYEDIGGVWTIGYGHTPCSGGITITQEAAETLLEQDLEKCGQDVTIYVGTVNQNQFDALCSFIFNIGIGNFINSTVRKELLVNDYGNAAQEFLKWIDIKGVPSQGLLNRRKAEKELFLTSISKPTNA